MDKNDWYKLLAIGIVLVFVIEGIAIGVMQNNGNKGAGEPAGSSAASLTGTVNTNVTIVRYEPYVIVSGGNSSAVEEAKQKLIDSGIATYAVVNGKNLVVSLKSGKDALAAGAEFEKANATVVATASITTEPKLRVVGTEISTAVDGTSFSMQLRPVFDEGSTAPATFAANIENGIMVSLGNFAMLPTYVSGALVPVPLVGETQAAFSVAVPWQNRSAAKPLAAAAGAIYREKSFITVSQNATQQQLQAFASGKGYISAVQPGVISVKNGFVDRLMAQGDLAKAGLAGGFPDSLATFANASGNRSAGSLAANLKAAGIDATLVSSRTLKARLPDVIEKGGKKFRTGGIGVSFEQTGEAVNNTVYLSIDFSADGSTLYQLLSVKQVQ